MTQLAAREAIDILQRYQLASLQTFARTPAANVPALRQCPQFPDINYDSPRPAQGINALLLSTGRSAGS